MPFPHRKSRPRTAVEPPEGFQPAGTVTQASPTTFNFAKRRAETVSERQGLKYEKLALQALIDEIGRRNMEVDFYPHQGFVFHSAEGAGEEGTNSGRAERALGSNPRYCQPDAIVVGDREIVLVEIKLVHTRRAWFQLFQLYRPVVQRWTDLEGIGQGVEWRHIEMCARHDPTQRIPGPLKQLDMQEDWYLDEDELGLIIWNPA